MIGFPASLRYSKALTRVLKKASAELARRGLKPEDMATHSTRKGAYAYCSGGSTACPPQVSIILRAGWTLNGVQDRYIRFEAAGGRYGCRVVLHLLFISCLGFILFSSHAWVSHCTSGDQFVG